MGPRASPSPSPFSHPPSAPSKGARAEDSAALRIKRKRRDEKEKKDKKGWIPVGRPGRLPRPDGRNVEPTGELGNTARVLPGPDSDRRT